MRWLLPEALIPYPVRGYSYKRWMFCRIARGLSGCDCEADHYEIVRKRNKTRLTEVEEGWFKG